MWDIGLRLRVKVGHRLLNLCECDSVLSERCRQASSQDLKNNNPILLRRYLNLISVIVCSKTVHNITQRKSKLLVYVQSSCTKITCKEGEGRGRAEKGTGQEGEEGKRGEGGRGPEREGREEKGRGPMTLWHGAPQCLNLALPVCISCLE